MPRKVTNGSDPVAEEVQAAPEVAPEAESPEAAAVAEAAAKVAEAAAVHAEAKAQLDAAHAAHAEAVKATEPKVERSKHVLVAFKGTNDYTLRDKPAGYNPDVPDRTIVVDGVTVEHCEDVATESGIVWAFRQM